MRTHTTQSLGPEKTPNVVKYLILSTLGISIFSALFSSLFPIQYFLGLSLSGIKQGFIWQLLSYIFVQPIPAGISFSFLLHLLFNLYLLWVIGTAIVERSNPKQFLALYFFSAIFAGAVSVALMSLFQVSPLIGGSSPAIYSLLIAWMMLYPDMQISLFFVVPFKAKWLILGLLGANLLIDLSNHDWMSFSLYLSASVFGYLFSVMKWKLNSPFNKFLAFERILMKFPSPWTYRMKKTRSPGEKSKIFDFKTGAPVLSDEEFMDKMLSKISLYGEDFVSEKDKKRMNKIAKKKKLSETT